MGMFDWMTGSKRAPSGVARLPKAQLREALLALNSDELPWQVRDGAPEGVDLVAEWKIVDARWYEMFAKAGLERVFKVLMKLDEGRADVRAMDEAWTVEWSAGVPVTKREVSGFKGQSWEMSGEIAFGVKEDLSVGELYRYKFTTDEIKKPLTEAALRSGWNWKGVAFGKL